MLSGHPINYYQKVEEIEFESSVQERYLGWNILLRSSWGLWCVEATRDDEVIIALAYAIKINCDVIAWYETAMEAIEVIEIKIKAIRRAKNHQRRLPVPDEFRCLRVFKSGEGCEDYLGRIWIDYSNKIDDFKPKFIELDDGGYYVTYKRKKVYIGSFVCAYTEQPCLWINI